MKETKIEITLLAKLHYENEWTFNFVMHLQ